MEVDAQSVVFDAWYLTYFDEAFSAYVADRGLPYEKMIEAGFDVSSSTPTSAGTPPSAGRTRSG
jgi:acyl-CoA thioesterase FadM